MVGVEGAVPLDLVEDPVAVVLLEEALVVHEAVQRPWVEVHFLAEDHCMRPEAEVDWRKMKTVLLEHIRGKREIRQIFIGNLPSALDGLAWWRRWTALRWWL